jgi:EAL domain-containing protein (putative c-di-GMP-specific phosphodiesterase class I)
MPTGSTIQIAPAESECLPLFLDKLDDIKIMLKSQRSLGMLLVDASSLGRIELIHGRRICRDLLQRVCGIMNELRGKIIRKADLITVNRLGGDQIYVFLSKKRKTPDYCSSDLDGLSERIGKEINHRVFEECFAYLKGNPDIAVGHSIVIDNPLIEQESLIDRLIDDARTMARFQRFRSGIRNKEKLQEIIIKEELTIVFQPIVDLRTKRIMGYEALTRGPAGSEYENPYFLFDTAKEVGLIFELDRICRKRALLKSAWLEPDASLFINCLPGTIHDPEFKGDYLNELLADVRRRPQNVVIEVSEREAIEDYSAFRAALRHYSELGFSIAVDDTGAGYSSLEAIVELEPDFLKLDISMIRGIHEHLLKQELIKAIVSFSKNIDATIIAEGIETQEELTTLEDLGVPLGQGFLFGRPREIATRDDV